MACGALAGLAAAGSAAATAVPQIELLAQSDDPAILVIEGDITRQKSGASIRDFPAPTR